MKSLSSVFAVICLLFTFSTQAQYFKEHEFGLHSGVYQLRSDYGERFDRETNNENSGNIYAITYYLNRASRRNTNYFKEHTRYRFDLLYMDADLQHYGDYADDPRLMAMTGSFWSIGVSGGVEYYPFGIMLQGFNTRYYFFQKLAPYGGVAVGLNFVSNEAESSLDGGLANPDNVFPTFVGLDTDDGIVVGNRVVGSLNLRAGLRYNFNPKTGLFVESSWMLFGSDLVDGLSPIGPQNKYTDWSWGVNVGFSTMLF